MNPQTPASPVRIAAIQTVAGPDVQANLDIDLPAACYFPVGDVEALRRKLLQPHDTYRVDHQGIIRRFDWSSAARQTKDIYAEVCAAR